MSTAIFHRARPLAISVISLIIVFGLLYVWRASHAGEAVHAAPPPLPVSALQVQPRNVAEELQAVGSLQAVHEVMLAPDTSGRVTSIHFDAGQMVKEGDVLVQLYDAPEQADRAAALSRVDFAQLQLRRSQKLASTGAEPHELLEQRKAEADQAVAAVQQLDARIQQKSIRAPFSGQIGLRRINVGQYLNAGDAIATLTQLEPLYVNFTLPQQDLSKLTTGAPVQVSVDAAPNQFFSANISTIEPRIDSETRNVAIQALLPNAGHTLKSGMYVTTRLTLPATSNVIVLPLTAIQTSASGDSVVLVRDVNAQGTGKTVAVPVITGRRLGDDLVVNQGVSTGDIVVTSGQNRIPPGSMVKIQGDNLSASPAPTPAAASATGKK